MMNAMFYIPALLVLLLSACARQQQVQSPAPVVSNQIGTEADAIAVVLADIQRRGGDPRREECSAKKIDGDWWVMAWHVWYPKNVGSSRFVPGGHTTYVVSTNGKIVKTLPGRVMTQPSHAPMKAAVATASAHAAPDGAWELFGSIFYNHVAPLGLARN